jgi:hypothetical protein
MALPVVAPLERFDIVRREHHYAKPVLVPVLARALARLEEGIDALTEHATALRRLHAAASEALTPVDYHPVGNAFVGAGAFPTGTCAVNLGSPDQGHVWLLRQLAIGNGVGGVTAGLAGRADVFVAPTQPVLPTPSPIGWRSTTSSLPNTGTWKDREVVVKAEENLWVVVTGSTNGAQVFCEATVLDYEEHAALQAFGL